VAVLEAVMKVADPSVIAQRLATVLEEAMRDVDDSTPLELRLKLEDMRMALLQAGT
jgi:hypothetical protein